MNRLLTCIYALVVLVLIMLASGCGPFLTAQSAPPPGRTAILDENDGHYDLDITQGVAIAVSCYHDGPCANVVVSTENQSIADVKGASFGTLEHSAYTRRSAAPAGIVIVGKAAGKTKVRVKTKNGSRTINVTVLPPPSIGSLATRAVSAAPGRAATSTRP